MERIVSCRNEACGSASPIMASCPRIAGAGTISTPPRAMLSSSPARGLESAALLALARDVAVKGSASYLTAGSTTRRISQAQQVQQ